MSEKTERKAQRVQIDVVPRTLEGLELIKQETGLSTNSQAIANAVNFKAQIIKELAKDESSRLLIVNDKGKTIQLLMV